MEVFSVSPTGCNTVISYNEYIESMVFHSSFSAEGNVKEETTNISHEQQCPLWTKKISVNLLYNIVLCLADINNITSIELHTEVKIKSQSVWNCPLHFPVLSSFLLENMTVIPPL